jgi:hypothetical protein
VLRIDSLQILDDAHPSFFMLDSPIFSQVIPPGQSLAVRLQFAPPDCGSHLATLRIFNNAPTHPQFDVTLRGAALLRSEIEVVNSSIDFGTVCNETSATLALPIFNFGCADLKITGVVSSNPAFRVVTPLPHTVPAGQGMLQVVFAPTESIAYNGTLSIFSNDPDEVPVVNVSGSGGVADIAGAAAVDFDSVEVQTCSGNTNISTRLYVIRNPGFCDLTVNLPDTVGVFAVSPHGQQIIKPGDSLNVELKFTPNVPGEFVDTLRITNNVPNRSPFLVALHGLGIAAPDIAITPSDTLDFGAVPVGIDKRLPVIIKNLGALPLSVDSLVIKSKIFATGPLKISLNCNDSISVEVAFMPSGQGIFIDSLLIYSNDPNGNTFKQDMLLMVALAESENIPVRFGPTAGYKDAGTASIFSNAANEKPAVLYLRGKGTAPDIAVTPDTLDFGAVCGGGDSLMFVTVKNEGIDTLRVNSLVFSNTAFSTTQVTPFVVAPNESVQIPVEYAYVEGREDNETLSIFSNDPDENPVIVKLHGEGSAPDIAFTAPDSIEVCSGKSAPIPICIINLSNACSLRVDSVLVDFFFGSASSKTSQKLPNVVQSAPLKIIPPNDRFCFTPGRANPQSPGRFRADVIVWSNAPSSPDTITIPGNAPPPIIAGLPAEVKFPEVEMPCAGNPKPSTQTFTLRNDGHCDLKIDSLGTAAPFSVVSPSVPQIVPANGNLAITLQFAPADSGNFSGILRIVSNDPNNPKLSIPLHGRAVFSLQDIAVDPLTIDFGDVPVRASKPLSILKIKNEGRLTLSVDSLVSSLPAVFIPGARNFILTCGEDSVVTVTFRPPSIGSFAGTLKICSNDPDTSENPVVVILRGNGIETGGLVIVAKPDSLDFGTACGPADSIIIITNLGQSPVQIDTLRFSNPAFSSPQTLPFVVPANDSVEVIVRFTPVVPGRAETGTLTIISNDPNINTPIVNLKGIGGVPDIAADSTVVNFSTVTLTCSGPANLGEKTLIIRNEGTCDLVIDSLLTGGVFSAVSFAHTVVPPGDSFEITLRFAPQDSGHFTGTLCIFSNDLDESPLCFNLIGRAVSMPDIAANPTAVDFGVVCSPATGTAIISVVNEGRAEMRVDSLRFSNPAFSTTHLVPFTVAACDTERIVIHFTPVADSVDIGMLSIFSNDPDENPFLVNLRGTGGAPKFAGATAMSFDTVEVTCNGVVKPDTQTYVIRNEGTCELMMVLPDLVGVFSLVSPLSKEIVVPPDSSVTIVVQFAPSVPGAYGGQLIIEINDPTENPIVVALHGIAVEAPPQIVVNPDTLDFGPVPVGGKKALPITVKNFGADSLVVDSLVFSSPAFTTETKEFALACNDSQIVSIAFSPTAARAYNDTLWIYSNDPDESPVVVLLRGEGVHPLIATDSLQYRFGRVCLGDSASLPVVVTNTGNAPLHVDSVRVLPNDGIFSCASDSFTLAPGQSKTLTVTFVPPAAGTFSAKLQIFSNAANASLYEIQLEGTGGVPEISGATVVSFLPTKVDSISQRTYVLSNVGDCPLVINSSSITGDHPNDFRVIGLATPVVIDPQASLNVTLEFAPSDTGLRKATWEIVNSDPKQPLFVVQLNGSGIGEPAIVIVPDTLEYPPVCLNEELALCVTVKNRGKENLVVTQVIAAPFPIFHTEAGEFLLEPGDSTTVCVIFTPQDTIEYYGTLTFVSNAANDSNFVVPLRGRGAAPHLSGDKSVTFRDTCVGHADTVSYTIVGDGHCDLRLDSLTITGANAAEFDTLNLPPLPYTIPANGSLVFKLTFAPNDTGARSAQMNIWSDDPRQKPFVVLLNGRGSAQTIAGATDVTFPDTEKDSTATQPYTVFNTGACVLRLDSLTISGLNKTNFGYAPISMPQVIPAGGSLNLTLRFTPSDSGAREALLNIWNDDPGPNKNPFVVNLHGRGFRRPPMIATDSLLYRFASLCADSVGSVNVIVTNVGGDTLKVDSVRVVPLKNGIFWTNDTAGFSLTPRETKQLTVFFKPTSGDTSRATLEIFSSNASNGNPYGVSLLGIAGAPEIDGFSSVTFLPTKVDSVRKNFYFVNNVGDCPLAIVSMKVKGIHPNDFRVIGLISPIPPIPPGASYRVTLEFAPSDTGLRKAILEIVSTDPGRRLFEVELNGKGISGQLSVQPLVIAYGDVCQGDVVARACTLKNIGEAELTVTKLEFVSGTVFSFAQPVQVPFPLGPDSSKIISVNYAPSQAVPTDDTLLVYADLPPEKIFRLPLSGNGSDEPGRIELSRRSVEFYVPLNGLKTDTVTITNGGCQSLVVREIDLQKHLYLFSYKVLSPLPRTLERRESLDVLVSFFGDDFGRFLDSLKVTNAPSMTAISKVDTVSLLGEVVDNGTPCLDAPKVKDFGEVPVQQTKLDKIMLKNCNSQGRLIVLIPDQPKHGEFKALADRLEINQTNPQSLDLSFTPQFSGLRVDTLRLVFYAPSQENVIADTLVELRGTGTGRLAYALPNVFTPNGDEYNPRAKIRFAGFDSSAVSLRIFDLRGFELRASEKVERDERGLFIGWNGLDVNNRLQLPGTYIWILEERGKRAGSGVVVLVR